jgi:fructose 1,6-bisphosphate aldolase/phosphatase
VIAAGFQLAGGEFLGPLDLFDDPSFDPVRARAMEIVEYMRRHGPFEPHRVPHDQMANTPFPPLLARLEDRMVSLDDKKRKKKQAASAAEDGE